MRASHVVTSTCLLNSISFHDFNGYLKMKKAISELSVEPRGLLRGYFVFCNNLLNFLILGRTAIGFSKAKF